MRVVAIGDVGVLDGMIHIGDEAMFEAAVSELRARGIDDIVGISANPADTSQRYGIEAVGGASSELIRDNDAVIITGGGNLSSLWPIHIDTRLALGRLAREHGTPVVVSGQTIGPYLDAEGSARVAELLGSARLVGLREGRSFALCQRLGIPGELLRQTVDDASFLVTETPEPGGYCLVTLANHVGDADRNAMELAIARLLDEVVATTGLTIVFAAHFGSLVAGPARGDSAMHERVAAHMSAASQVAPTTDSIAAARLARGADLVVCSRYHPAVFAVSAGVPTIGLPVDDYTSTKLSGALGNFGQHSTLAAERLLDGGGTRLLQEVWDARSAIRAEGRRLARIERQHSLAWWDDVVAHLSGT